MNLTLTFNVDFKNLSPISRICIEQVPFLVPGADSPWNISNVWEMRVLYILSPANWWGQTLEDLSLGPQLWGMRTGFYLGWNLLWAHPALHRLKMNKFVVCCFWCEASNLCTRPWGHCSGPHTRTSPNLSHSSRSPEESSSLSLSSVITIIITHHFTARRLDLLPILTEIHWHLCWCQRCNNTILYVLRKSLSQPWKFWDYLFMFAEMISGQSSSRVMTSQSSSAAECSSKCRVGLPGLLHHTLTQHPGIVLGSLNYP